MIQRIANISMVIINREAFGTAKTISVYSQGSGKKRRSKKRLKKRGMARRINNIPLCKMVSNRCPG